MDNTFPVVITVDGTTHNLTETGIKELIEARNNADRRLEELKRIRTEIRDFFNAEEWSDGEQTVIKSEVNMLLESIGCAKLTTKYQGTYTITGTFTVEVEEEDEVESTFTDNVSVDFYYGDIEVDNIDVMDVEETN